MLPMPHKGDVIYVPSRWFIDRGQDDTKGGKATVNETKTLSFGMRCVEVKELPGVGFSWDYLAGQQEILKKLHGDSWACPDPDFGGTDE